MEEPKEDKAVEEQNKLPPLKNPFQLLADMIINMARWLEKKPDEFDVWAEKFEEENGEAGIATRFFLLSLIVTIPLVFLTLYSLLTVFRVYSFWDIVGQAVWTAVFGVLMLISGSISWVCLEGIFEGLKADRKKEAKKEAKKAQEERNQ